GEVVRLARALANPRTFAGGVHTAWLRKHRSSLEQLQTNDGLRLLLALLALRNDYYPDFLTPTPAVSAGDICDELATIRAAPRDQVEFEINLTLDGAASLSPELKERLQAPEIADRLADTVELLWQVLVEPSWHELQDLLERDVLHR